MGKVKEVLSKNKVVVILIVIIILLAAVIGIKFALDKYNENKKEEETQANIKNAINEYMEAFNDLDTSRLLESIDLKAACAWSECEGNLDEFETVYGEITEEDIQEYNSDLGSKIEMNKTFYEKYLDYHEIELTEINSYEDVDQVEGLVRVTAKITERYSYEGQEETLEENVYYYIYNGKLISMETIEDVDTQTETNSNTETTEDTNVTEDPEG